MESGSSDIPAFHPCPPRASPALRSPPAFHLPLQVPPFLLFYCKNLNGVPSKLACRRHIIAVLPKKTTRGRGFNINVHLIYILSEYYLPDAVRGSGKKGISDIFVRIIGMFDEINRSVYVFGEGILEVPGLAVQFQGSPLPLTATLYWLLFSAFATRQILRPQATSSSLIRYQAFF